NQIPDIRVRERCARIMIEWAAHGPPHHLFRRNRVRNIQVSCDLLDFVDRISRLVTIHSRTMLATMTNRHALPPQVLDRCFDIFQDGLVQRYLPGLQKLQHGHGRYRLANAGNPKQRFRRNGPSLFCVCESKSPRVDEPPLTADRERTSRHSVLHHELQKEFVKWLQARHGIAGDWYRGLRNRRTASRHRTSYQRHGTTQKCAPVQQRLPSTKSVRPQLVASIRVMALLLPF